MNKKTQPSDKLDVPIRRYVTNRLIAVNKNSSIQDAASRMVEFNISSLGIVEGDNVIGIVTDKDLKKRGLAEGRSPKESVSEIMTHDPVTADISSSVLDVLKLMSKNKIKYLFVTENGKVVGVTTLKELEDLDLQGLETFIAR